jgi:hypothetical protein
MTVGGLQEIGTPESALHVWALRVFLRAYENPDNRRVKCSRQDFWAGYRAALIETESFAHFRVSPQ